MVEPAVAEGMGVSMIESRSILTPGSGFITGYKFTLNPYAGCQFACGYCYARGFAPSAELRDGWGEWVKAKTNARRLVERAICSRSARTGLGRGDTIYMSSVTDPYQPIERKLGITRQVLETLLSAQPRLTIQTRSPIVVRDIDLLKQFDHVRVNITITTDDEAVRLRYEPHCPSIAVRWKTLEALRSAGVAIGVSLAPLLPVSSPRAFGERLAALDAREYTAQYLHEGASRFRASTPSSTQIRVHADGWHRERYEAAVGEIRAALGPSRPLLEGSNGFRPPD